MPISSQTSAKLSAAAKTAPRDAHGHFIKKSTNPAQAVAKEVKTQTPLETIQTPPKTVTSTSDIDAPLIVVNNPFRKLLHWFDEIRRKQTTTFDFKISIPLIALPVFLIVLGTAFQYVFTLGKESGVTTPPPQTTIYPTPTAEPLLISKAGVIKATYQLQSRSSAHTLISRVSQSVLADEITPTSSEQLTATPIPPTYTPIPTNTPIPTLTPTPTIPPTRFVLVDKDERIFFLITPKTVDLNKYTNQRVLITGLYDPSKETITIKKYADIEVLP